LIGIQLNFITSRGSSCKVIKFRQREFGSIFTLILPHHVYLFSAFCLPFIFTFTLHLFRFKFAACLPPQNVRKVWEPDGKKCATRAFLSQNIEVNGLGASNFSGNFCFSNPSTGLLHYFRVPSKLTTITAGTQCWHSHSFRH